MIVTPAPEKSMPQETAESGGFILPAGSSAAGPSQTATEEPPPSYTPTAPASSSPPPAAHSISPPQPSSPSLFAPPSPQTSYPHSIRPVIPGSSPSSHDYGSRRREKRRERDGHEHEPEDNIDYTGPWSRPAPAGVSTISFQPTSIIPKQNNSLSKGFPPAPPPCNVQPHPFASNDITEADWRAFTSHLEQSAKLTKKEKGMAYRIPILPVVPIVGPVVRYGVETYLKSKKPTSVAQVVDTWNYHFFHPRKIDISLWKGFERISHAHVLGETAGKSSTPSQRSEKAQFGDFQQSGSGSGSTSAPGTSTVTTGFPVARGKEKDETWRLYVAPL